MGQHVSHLEVDSRLEQLEKWDYERVCEVIDARDPKGNLDTGALTKEKLFLLLKYDPDLYETPCANTTAQKNEKDTDSEGSNESHIFLEEEIALFERFGVIALQQILKLQAAVRGNFVRSAIRREKEKKRREREKVFTLFLDKNGEDRLENIWEFFCQNGNSVNPFDGQDTIDVLDVTITLVLLCVGTAKQKFGKLFEMFALEDPCQLNKDELNLLLIVAAKAISNITAIPILPNILESIAKSIDDSQAIDREMFFGWAIRTKEIAQWAGKLCFDIRFITVELGGKLYFVVTGNKLDDMIIEQKKVESSIDLPSWVGAFPIHMTDNLQKSGLDLNNPLDFQSTYFSSQSRQCFVLPPLSTCTAIVLHRISVGEDGNSNVVESSQAIFLGIPYVSICPIPDNTVYYGKPASFSFAMSPVMEDRIDCWNRNDWIGIYDSSAPLGTKGSFSKVFVYRGSLETKTITFDTRQLPGAGARSVLYGRDKQKSTWINFHEGGKIPYATFSDIMGKNQVGEGCEKLKPGETVLVRLSKACTCLETGEMCECYWVLAILIQFRDDGSILVDRTGQLQEDSQSKPSKDTIAVEMSRIRAVKYGSRDAVIPQVNDVIIFENREVLHRVYKSIFQCFHVTYSGKYVLRYISYNQGSSVVSCSEPFEITPYKVDFLEFKGGDAEDDIVCSFLSESISKIADNSFIGLYPYDWPHTLEPWKEDVLCFPKKAHFYIEQTMSHYVIFQPYYYPQEYGGLFEFRYIEPDESRISAISNMAFVSPIFRYIDIPKRILRKENTVLGQNLVCKFQIVCPEVVWSQWDVIKLLKVEISIKDNDSSSDDDSDSEATEREVEVETMVGWRYITPKQKDQGWVSIPLNKNIGNGMYRWRYCGVCPKLRTVTSDTFEIYEEVKVVIPTQEEIEADHTIIIQKNVRRFIAGFILRRRLQQLKDESKSLYVALKKANVEYEKLKKANARRNQMLLSQKDKNKEKKAFEEIGSIEAEIREMKNINLDVVERENQRIGELRLMAKEEREKRLYDKAIKDENERRRNRREELYIKHSGVVLDWSIFDSVPKSDTELVDISKWCKLTNELYEDDEFEASVDSVFGDGGHLCRDYVKDILLPEDIEWLRPPSFADKKTGPILFANPIMLDDIGLTSVHPFFEINFDSFYTALRLCIEYHSESVLPYLIDTNFAEFGFYGVKVWWGGKLKTVVVDDRFPCVLRNDINEKKRRSNIKVKPRWMPAFGSAKTGLWTLLLEKTWAKLHGSYNKAMCENPKYSIHQILSVFLGGISMSYHSPEPFVFVNQDERCEPAKESLDDASLFNTTLGGNFINSRLLTGINKGSHEMLLNFVRKFTQKSQHQLIQSGQTNVIEKVHITAKFEGCPVTVTRYAECELIRKKVVCEDINDAEVEANKGDEDDESEVEEETETWKVVLLNVRPSYCRFKRSNSWVWNGDFSDSSNLWTDEAKDQTGFDIIDDGSFWISSEDFIKCAETWGCYMHLNKEKCKLMRSIPVSWRGNSTGVKLIQNGHLVQTAVSAEGWLINAAGNDFFLTLNVEDLSSPETRLLVLEKLDAASECSTDPKVHAVGIVGNGVKSHTLSVSGASEVMVIPVLWHLGLQSKCSIDVWVAESSHAQPITERNFVCENIKFSNSTKMEEFGIKRDTEPTDNLSLQQVRIPEMRLCLGCGERIHPNDVDICYKFHGMLWHRKCFGCQKCFDSMPEPEPREELLLLDDELDEGIQYFPIFPVATLSYSISEKKFNLLCAECWKLEQAPGCAECDLKLNLAGRCESCDLKRLMEVAPKCHACTEALIPIALKFSGETFTIDDVVIHVECQQLYKEIMAPKCPHCEGPMCKVPGKFSGKVKKIKIGFIHSECFDAILEEKKAARKK